MAILSLIRSFDWKDYYPLCGTLVSMEDFYSFYTPFGSLKGKGRVWLGWVEKDVSSAWFMWGKRKGCRSNPHCAQYVHFGQGRNRERIHEKIWAIYIWIFINQKFTIMHITFNPFKLWGHKKKCIFLTFANQTRERRNIFFSFLFFLPISKHIYEKFFFFFFPYSFLFIFLISIATKLRVRW